jgi:hypothetical protein
MYILNTPNQQRAMLAGIALTMSLVAPAYADTDDIALLDSLLARGLIAPEDHAAEMARQRPPIPLAVADVSVKKPRADNSINSNDAKVDYQWISAMNEASDAAPSTHNHDATSHQDATEHASHNHFEGAYFVITEEWKRPSVRVDGEKISVSEAAPSFGAGYTFALSDHMTLGFKAGIDFKSGEFGKGDISGTETVVLEKSHYSLAVEPGYVLDQHTLVFGILAYHHARTAFEGGTQTVGISGVGYGVGFKRTLADHLFLMGEIQQVKYGSATVDGSTVKPTSNTAALGLGYHF